MVPCCQRSEMQYLMPATKMPSREWVDKTYGEEATVEVREDKLSGWGELVFKQHGWYPTITSVRAKGELHDLCTCSCHVIGSMLMH